MPFQLEKVTLPLRRPPRFHGRAVGGCFFFFGFQSCGIRLRAKISCINMWDVSKIFGNKEKITCQIGLEFQVSTAWAKVSRKMICFEILTKLCSEHYRHLERQQMIWPSHWVYAGERKCCNSQWAKKNWNCSSYWSGGGILSMAVVLPSTT